MSKLGRSRDVESWGSAPVPVPPFSRDQEGVVWGRDGLILSAAAYDALGLSVAYDDLPAFDNRNQNVFKLEF